MSPIQILRIVVASPGDVQAERDALTTVVEELNRGIVGLSSDAGKRMPISAFIPKGPKA
jgi:hypothetical protein